MKHSFLILAALFLSHTTFAQFSGWGAQSRVETKVIHSKVLNAEREYNIFLPKSYDTDVNKKYPILYFFHGMGGTNTGWFHGLTKDLVDQLVASGEVCEMIMVVPNAGGNVIQGAWNGYFDMPGWKYETFFFTEFLPHIESTYRVIGDKQHRAIAGLSMGGGGATSYGQRHSDKFIAVYAMSALMDIPEWGAAQPQSEEDKTAILTKSVQEHSCIKYVADANDVRKAQLRSVKWFIDCGDDDFLLDRNIEFIQAMRAAQIPCEFRVRDGSHTSEYWHSALYICFPFVSRSFGK